MEVNPNSFLFFLGDVDLLKGDPIRAKKVYEESVNFLRTVGNIPFLAYPLRRLGYLALGQNDIPNASRYIHQSLTLNYEAGDLPGMTASLTSMAQLALRLNKPLVAARLYGAVENRLESLSLNLLFTDQTELASIAKKLPTYLDQATLTHAFNEGWEMSLEQAIQLAEGIFERETSTSE